MCAASFALKLKKSLKEKKREKGKQKNACGQGETKSKVCGVHSLHGRGQNSKREEQERNVHF